MKVAITGSSGQLGSALASILDPADATLFNHKALNITDRQAVMESIGNLSVDVVIHCAAKTDVDGCALNPETAYQVNSLGTQNIALACSKSATPLVYISSNEVFDGTANSPYREWSSVNPINPYGGSKAAGEWFVTHLLQRFYIVRTAWLYSPKGHNFPQRILEIAAHEKELKVVTDEVSNPTSVTDLATALIDLIETEAYGIYHLTNSGHCSRYTFACRILREMGWDHVSVTPILLANYSRASTPPHFTPLVNTAATALNIRLRPWQDALADFLAHN